MRGCIEIPSNVRTDTDRYWSLANALIQLTPSLLWLYTTLYHLKYPDRKKWGDPDLNTDRPFDLKAARDRDSNSTSQNKDGTWERYCDEYGQLSRGHRGLFLYRSREAMFLNNTLEQADTSFLTKLLLYTSVSDQLVTPSVRGFLITVVFSGLLPSFVAERLRRSSPFREGRCFYSQTGSGYN